MLVDEIGHVTEASDKLNPPFLPGSKDGRSPQPRGLPLFQRHPHRESIGGWGYVEGRGIGSGTGKVTGSPFHEGAAIFYVVAKTMEQKHCPLVIYQIIREDNDAVGRLTDRLEFDLFRYQH